MPTEERSCAISLRHDSDQPHLAADKRNSIVHVFMRPALTHQATVCSHKQQLQQHCAVGYSQGAHAHVVAVDERHSSSQQRACGHPTHKTNERCTQAVLLGTYRVPSRTLSLFTSGTAA
jgi:hypothetical protein